MSGHSKWSNIKRKKAIVDSKRAKTFAKFIKAIAIAARTDSNPDTNAPLRAAIQRARDNNVPKENIERVLSRSSENKNFESLRIEAYGPGGGALIIEIISDNRNRAIAEIKKVLSDHGAKMAAPGSVLWLFNESKEEKKRWTPKFPQKISENDLLLFRKLITALENHEDTQSVFTNIE